MKVDKSQFYSLLLRMMKSPPEPAKEIKTKGRPGNNPFLLLSRQNRVRHSLRIISRRVMLKPSMAFRAIEATLKFAQVAV